MRQTCESERENGGNNDAERERTSESEIEDLGAQLDKACASRPLDRARLAEVGITIGQTPGPVMPTQQESEHDVKTV